MSIVFITIPGEAKREFADHLWEKTDGGLKLVVIQKPKSLSMAKRLKRFLSRVQVSVFSELWYALMLRLNPSARSALEYFRIYTPKETTPHKAVIMEVESVNAQEVYEALKKISPDLLVVWGCSMLSPKILSTAKKAINFHLGYCPYYRGALGNQYAVYLGDFEKIGATIHYINEKPDAGDVLSIVAANPKMPPRELFRDLNDRANAEYLSIALRLHSGEQLPSTPQDMSVGKMLYLKSWTPKMRYALGKKILAWEKRSNLLLVGLIVADEVLLSGLAAFVVHM